MLAQRDGTRAALNNVAVTKDADSAVVFLEEQELSRCADDSCACILPAVPETKENEKGRLPESFDELAIYLNVKFGGLAAEVEQMANELREAEIRSEQLRHRLLDGCAF